MSGELAIQTKELLLLVRHSLQKRKQKYIGQYLPRLLHRCTLSESHVVVGRAIEGAMSDLGSKEVRTLMSILLRLAGSMVGGPWVGSGLWGKNEIGFDADDGLSGRERGERDGVEGGLRAEFELMPVGLMTGTGGRSLSIHNPRRISLISMWVLTNSVLHYEPL